MERRFIESNQELIKDLTNHRANLFVQKIIWQNQLQATKYMSLWIEAKNNKLDK